MFWYSAVFKKNTIRTIIKINLLWNMNLECEFIVVILKAGYFSKKYYRDYREVNILRKKTSLKLRLNSSHKMYHILH